MDKILLTGSSGFLGSEIYQSLLKNKFCIKRIGINIDDDIYCNLATSIPRINGEYNWVIHCAGKAHTIPKNSKESAEFFEVNFEGTKNLIKGIEQVGKLPTSIIFISTVSVYGLEFGENINEEQSLMGSSPYALSKIKAEELNNACLLCSEPTPEQCHRNLVAEYFREKFGNIDIKHL